ncbi:MAG: efflux RND transporter periplasmic adaptor subunit [Victivallaceae bacterium]|nr:efflux RND transporter periplasmic adaptor subunit [Victivallaceae bacterium]
MMKRKRLITAIVVIAVLVGVAIVAVKRKKAELAKAKPVGERAIPVSVVPVIKGNFAMVKHYIGIVEPLNSANVSSRITADIVKVLHREGSEVKQGELLLKLDDRNLVQAIAVLKAKSEGIKTQIISNNVNIQSLSDSVAYWKKQVERDRKLFVKKIIPAKQFELSNEKLNEIMGQLNVAKQKNKTLTAELNANCGDVKIAETNLSYADITAPFAGVVCDVPVDPGDLAAPGKKLMVVENQHLLKISVQLPQSDMKYVKFGNKLHIECLGVGVTAKISKMYPALSSNRMMKIEAILQKKYEKDFVSGQYVKVSLTTGMLDNVMIVPSASINIDNQQGSHKYLFMLKNGLLHKIGLKILGNNELKAAVSGKLNVGDRVVVSAYLGWAELADGLKAEEVK